LRVSRGHPLGTHPGPERRCAESRDRGASRRLD
jgi:hypothetical protein